MSSAYSVDGDIEPAVKHWYNVNMTILSLVYVVKMMIKSGKISSWDIRKHWRGQPTGQCCNSSLTHCVCGECCPLQWGGGRMDASLWRGPGRGSGLLNNTRSIEGDLWWWRCDITKSLKQSKSLSWPPSFGLPLTSPMQRRFRGREPSCISCHWLTAETTFT